MGWGQPVHLPEMQPDTEPGLAAESIHPAGRRENSGLPAGEPVGAGHPPVCFMKLQGNKVIITGCSRGLGVAVAEAMWREGADLLLVARSGAALCEVRDRLAGSATAQQAHAFPADLGDPAAPQAVLAEARRLWSDQTGREPPYARFGTVWQEVPRRSRPTPFPPILVIRLPRRRFWQKRAGYGPGSTFW